MVSSLDESAAWQMAEEMGLPFEANLDSLKNADCVLTVNAGLAKDHMVAGFFIKRALPNGTRLVLAETDPGTWESIATLAIKPVECTTEALLQGLSAGLILLGVLEGDAEQAKRDMAQAVLATGVKEDELLSAAGIIGTAEKPVFVYSNKIELTSLRKLVELAKKTNAAVLSIKGEANSVAAGQYGLNQAFHLNGQQAVYVALGDDTPSEMLLKQLEKAPFLAIQASYASALTEQADVVLPVEMWAEQEGHYINLEGRLQNAARSLTAPEGVRSNLATLQALAESLQVEANRDWREEVCARPAPVPLAV